jgi:ABC-type transport system involved in cytochrome c biogenesis permease subunit
MIIPSIRQSMASVASSLMLSSMVVFSFSLFCMSLWTCIVFTLWLVWLGISKFNGNSWMLSFTGDDLKWSPALP